MTLLRIIDNPVLLTVERGAHFVQRAFGIPPMALARVFYAVWMVAVFLQIVVEKRFIAICFWLPISLAYYAFGLQSEQNERQREAVQGFRNSNRESGYEIVLRVIWVFLALLPPHTWRLDVSGFSLALFAYLRACDTLPPGVSRVRNLWNALTRVSVHRPAQESV